LQRRLLLLLLLANDVYGLLQLRLPYAFLLNLQLYDLGSLHCCPSSGHIFLLEPEALVLVLKICQLYDGGFDFLLRILVLIIAGFS
jgi:hypothetical protein